jgi:hypothetical protein
VHVAVERDRWSLDPASNTRGRGNRVSDRGRGHVDQSAMPTEHAAQTIQPEKGMPACLSSDEQAQPELCVRSASAGYVCSRSPNPRAHSPTAEPTPHQQGLPGFPQAPAQLLINSSSSRSAKPVRCLPRIGSPLTVPAVEMRIRRGARAGGLYRVRVGMRGNLGSVFELEPAR